MSRPFRHPQSGGRRTFATCGFWLAVALLFVVSSRAQDPNTEPAWRLNDPAERVRIVNALRTQAETARAAAHARARAEGWSPRGVIGNRVYELREFRDGRPVFDITDNVNAAISTSANLVRNTAPYLLNGAGVTVGVWDGGGARTTHQEFGGRVTIMDGAALVDHSTHVAGTIAAAGTSASALGMAPSARVDSYDWNSDSAEMTSRGLVSPGSPTNGIPVSNHSYGEIAGWAYGNWSGTTAWHWFGAWGNKESETFGLYNSTAQTWDQVVVGDPYYLPFKSAGNDRIDGPPAAGETFYYYKSTPPRAGWTAKSYVVGSDPGADNWDNGGFDTIASYGVAKNVMTVGSVADAVSGGSRSLANATMSSFSCWGPADDGRIKPDIVANGESLTSAISSGDAAYGISSGTSMSTPNACGSAALLVEYWNRLSAGGYPRASTLKTLIIHTADDLGNAGPDYKFGWGLMNTRAAADVLTNHFGDPALGRVAEQELTTATLARTNTFIWDGTNPVRVTVCWTDPAGTARSNLDNTNRCLVNDVDLRVIGPTGVTNFPYILDRTNPAAPATTGDNNLDNVEQVYLASPAPGNYTIIVQMGGALSGGTQAYSLVLSGLTTGTVVTTDLEVTGNPANYGVVFPGYGTNVLPVGTPVASIASNAAVNTATGLYTYVATGFVGTGSAPALGATNRVTFTLATNSTLTWFWALKDLVASNQTVTGSVALAPRDTLVARDAFLVASNGTATLNAGKSVRLQQGFRADEGSRTRVTAP